MAEDLISSIIDEAAIQKQLIAVNGQLDTLAKRLKDFQPANFNATSYKAFSDDAKAYDASLQALAKTQTTVLSVEKQAAIERKRIADERAVQAKQAAADLKLQQIEIKKKQIAEQEAAIAAKQAAKEATEAGRERLQQLREEKEALEKAAQAETSRNAAEQQALSGTYNPGTTPKAAGGSANSVPLTVDQGNIVLIKTYQAEVIKLAKAEAELKAAFQSGKISHGEYAKQVAVNTEKVNVLKRGIADLTREQKLSDNVNSSERNSLQRAQALIAQYTNAKKSLNLATEDGKRLNDNYSKAIDNANKFLLKNADVETQRTKNIGNYGSALNKILGPLRTVANILPGIGLSGLFLLAFEGIQKVVEALGLFNNKMFDAAARTKLLGEVNKEAAENAGKEAGSLQVLRAEIESTNVPMETRLQAVKNLQKEYPEYFKGLTNEQILTGNVGNAYNLAAAAILRKARAQAASNEIDKVSSKNLQIELDLQLDAIETNKKIAKAKDDAAIASGGSAGVGGNLGGVSRQAKQKALAEDFEDRKKAARDELRINGEKINFLLKIATDGAKETVKIDEVKAKSAKKTSKERIDAEYEVFKIQQQLAIDQSKSVVDNDKEGFNDRLLFLQTYLGQRLDLINRNEQHEIEAAKGNKDKLKIIEAKFQDERARLAIEGQNTFEKIRDTRDEEADKKTIKRREELNARLHEILKKFVDTQAGINEKAEKDKDKKLKEAEQKEKEIAARKKELYKQLYEEIQQTVFQFIDDGFKREEQGLDERKRLLDEDTKRRINNINQLGLSEVERVKQTSLIEKNAQFQTEQIEARRRAIAVQRAKFEKAASIASIIAHTAEAVMKVAPVVPLMVLMGLIGGAQLARAISTPLPKYAKGTAAAKPGAGIFGEEGRELVIPIKGQPYLSPDVASITNFVGGEKIIPAKMTRALVEASGFGGLSGMDPRKAITQNSINNHLLGKMAASLQSIEKKSRIIINNTTDIKSTAWYQYHFKN